MDRNVIAERHTGVITSSRTQYERAFRRRLCEGDPVRTAIALLSDGELRLMSSRDLIDLIRMGQNSDCETNTQRELAFLERPDLERLALLIRRRLRRSINQTSEQNGYSPFFREPNVAR